MNERDALADKVKQLYDIIDNRNAEIEHLREKLKAAEAEIILRGKRMEALQVQLKIVGEGACTNHWFDGAGKVKPYMPEASDD